MQIYTFLNGAEFVLSARESRLFGIDRAARSDIDKTVDFFRKRLYTRKGIRFSGKLRIHILLWKNGKSTVRLEGRILNEGAPLTFFFPNERTLINAVMRFCNTEKTKRSVLYRSRGGWYLVLHPDAETFWSSLCFFSEYAAQVCESGLSEAFLSEHAMTVSDGNALEFLNRYFSE